MVWEFAISITFLPNEVNPRDVSPVEELVKVFQKRTLILGLEIQHSKTTFLFWSCHHGPSSLGIDSIAFIIPSPKVVLSKFIYLVPNTRVKVESAYEKHWE